MGVGVRERHGYAFNENKEERRGVFIISEQVEGGLETSIGAFMILRIYIDMEGGSFWWEVHGVVYKLTSVDNGVWCVL